MISFVRNRYMGRIGNQLFQYAFARILHELTGQKLAVPAVRGFPNAVPKDGLVYDTTKVVHIRHRQRFFRLGRNVLCPALFDIFEIGRQMFEHKYNVSLCGYFESYSYFMHWADQIIDDWYQIPIPANDTKPNDILMTVRLGDIHGHPNWHSLDASYYHECLQEMKGPNDRLFITSDEPDHEYMRVFDKYDPIFYKERPVRQLGFAKSFNRIIKSESTFSWWAAFLSRAEEVIFPRSAKGVWGLPLGDNLKVLHWQERWAKNHSKPKEQL